MDYFFNPLPALAVLGMALNDHWWKRAYPSWLTGKISDVLGLFYFPIFVCAFVCLVFNFVIRPVTKSHRVAYLSPGLMTGAMIIGATMMASIKLSPVVALQVETVFSALFFRIRITPDPSDLVSFASLPFSYVYAKRFFGRGPGRRPLS